MRRVAKIVGTILVLLFAVALLLALTWQRIAARLAPVSDPERALRAGEDLVDGATSVVVTGAHPDDIEWWCGGTLARLASKGATVIVVIATDTDGIADVRRREQMAAARILGYDRVVFLGYPDRKLAEQPLDRVADDIAEIIAKSEADTVITFDTVEPSRVYRHPDHLRVGEATLAAARRFRVPRVYGYHTRAPDTVVDISRFIEPKLDAIVAHRSQHRFPALLRLLTGARNGDEAARVQLERHSAGEGAKVGVRYAESFRLLE